MTYGFIFEKKIIAKDKIERLLEAQRWLYLTIKSYQVS